MGWLITGGCGFVGVNLAHHLLSAGEEVFLLDDLSRVGSSENLAWLRRRHSLGLDFFQADVRNADAVAAITGKVRPQVVAHLAGQVALTKSIESPRYDFEVNALGTLNVLEAVRQQSPESVVLYASTNKVYGSLDWLRCERRENRYVLPDYPDGLDESLPLDFHGPYSCSKGCGDQYVRDYHRIYGLRTVVFRHSSVYGGRQFATFDQGWMTWFVLQFLRQEAERAAGRQPEPFTISGDGRQVRDVLEAQDIVRCYLLAAQRIDYCAGEIFNIGGGPENSLSLLELFEEIQRRLGLGPEYEFAEWRAGDQKVFVSDLTRATQVLGWRPAVGVREGGLDRLIEWGEEWTARNRP